MHTSRINSTNECNKKIEEGFEEPEYYGLRQVRR